MIFLYINHIIHWSNYPMTHYLETPFSYGPIIERPQYPRICSTVLLSDYPIIHRPHYPKSTLSSELNYPMTLISSNHITNHIIHNPHYPPFELTNDHTLQWSTYMRDTFLNDQYYQRTHYPTATWCYTLINHPIYSSIWPSDYPVARLKSTSLSSDPD